MMGWRQMIKVNSGKSKDLDEETNQRLEDCMKINVRLEEEKDYRRVEE